MMRRLGSPLIGPLVACGALLVVITVSDPATIALVAGLGSVAATIRPLVAPGRPTERRLPSHTTTTTDAVRWSQFLDAAASEVRSGTSLADAWVQAGERQPVAGEAVVSGRSLTSSLSRATRDRDEAVVLQVAGAAVALGGPVAATLDAGAALLRERAAARADALAHGAQARLSARVMTAVPIVFATWSAVSSPSFRGAIASPIGGVSVVAGIGLNLAGSRWMRAVIARAAP